MTIELKDYENTIKTLVWKFRNLGFADMLYAPVIDTGSEAIAENKMCNVDEGSEEKKSFRYTVANFEDLISEAYVVFTELKIKYESGMLDENLTFEQALVKSLESHFLHLYEAATTQKRTAHVRNLDDKDEGIPIEISSSFYEKLREKLLDGSIPLNLRILADGILNDEVNLGERGMLTKESIISYLRKKGWSKQKSERFCYSLPV